MEGKMNTEIAALCDAATNSPDGRVNILGAFDRICAKVPFAIPQCAAVFRIRYQRSEEGAHKVTLSIEDVCGNPVLNPLESNINLEPVRVGYDTAAVNMILNMQRFPIKRADKYIVRLSIDDEELASIPLYVVAPPENPEAQAPMS